MNHEEPKAGKPGETSQWPRWEGPAENRPSGYLQGEADIFDENGDPNKKPDSDRQNDGEDRASKEPGSARP